MHVEYAVKIMHYDGTKETRMFKTLNEATRFMGDCLSEHNNASVSVVPVEVED